MHPKERVYFSVCVDGMKHWHKDKPDDDTMNNFDRLVFRPPYNQAPAVDIEMNSYVLLVYTRLKDFSNAVSVAKWIAAQRNANGGFSSTQVNSVTFKLWLSSRSPVATSAL